MRYFRDAIYLCLIVAVSPWLIYRAARHGKYRAGLAAKFLGRVPRRNGLRPCAWLHAVSVGEVNVLATILPRLAERWPDRDFYITTTTTTGFELAQQRFAEWPVSYAPLDFSWAVKQAIQRIRPDVLLLVELELWPNLIQVASQSGTRIAIVNGRLSQNSHRGYLRIRSLVGRLLKAIDVIAVQNPTYGERFLDLGASRDQVVVTGSVKFDGAQSDRDNGATRRLARLAGIRNEQTVFLAGSTQAPEEAMSIEVFRRLAPTHPELRLLLVPRHPERFAEVALLVDRAGFAWSRRSELTDGQPSDWRILLVDSVGELGAWWGTADVAFVGGSFGNRGGQNMIEPAAYGAAVCFGPNTKNFRDVTDALLACEGAEVVRDLTELSEFVNRHLCNPTLIVQVGDRAKRLVESQLGATQRTLDALSELLSTPHRKDQFSANAGNRSARSA